MAKNMANYFQEIYDGFIEFDKDDKYKPIYTKLAPLNATKFPVIHIRETRNITGSETTKREYQYDDLSYEINIYAKDKTTKDGELISCIEIADYLKLQVNQYFDVMLGMKRTFCEPMPILSNNVYRIVMRYSCSVDKQRNLIIRR